MTQDQCKCALAAYINSEVEQRVKEVEEKYITLLEQYVKLEDENARLRETLQRAQNKITNFYQACMKQPESEAFVFKTILDENEKLNAIISSLQVERDDARAERDAETALRRKLQIRLADCLTEMDELRPCRRTAGNIRVNNNRA